MFHSTCRATHRATRRATHRVMGRATRKAPHRAMRLLPHKGFIMNNLLISKILSNEPPRLPRKLPRNLPRKLSPRTDDDNDVLQRSCAHSSTLIVGPSFCGKTLIIKQITIYSIV